MNSCKSITIPKINIVIIIINIIIIISISNCVQAQKQLNQCKSESSNFSLTEKIENLTQKLCHDEIAYFLPGEENFEFLVANNGVSKFQKQPHIKPSIVILPKDKQQVAKIINIIKNFELPIGVRNGGHSNWGLANPSGGIVISMNNFKQIEINKEKKIIQIGGGVKMQEINDAINGTGLWLPLAGGPTVGYTGFLLHEGIDHSYCKFIGLASDSLLGATIVLSSSEIIEVDENNHADLFFALKGAGSIFGVVTKITVQLIDITNFSHDQFIYPYSEQTIKQSILFMKNISQYLSDVQVFLQFLSTGNENDSLQITTAYNNTDNQLRQIVSNQLKSNINQAEYFEVRKNLLPYADLNQNDEFQLIDFLMNLFSELPHTSIYSQGFKYYYLTEENVDKIINIYHKNQFIQKEIKNKKFAKFGIYHSLGGKIGESKSLKGLKNVEIFSLITDFYSPGEFQLFQKNFESIKQFGRNECGILTDIYINQDMFPIPNNFNYKKMADFVGGENNLNKIVELKNEYDPENVFTGTYFQQVFQD